MTPTEKKLSPAQLAALAAIVKHGRAAYSASHRIYKRGGISELLPAVVDTLDGVINTRSVVALLRRGLITLIRVPGQRDGVYRPTAAAYAMLGVAPPSTTAVGAHASKKKSGAQRDREIATALAPRRTTVDDDDDGVFYLTDVRERSLGPEFSSRAAAKHAAMQLVREGDHPHVEVWHRWRGDRYMQGQATAEGWSDV